MVCSRRGHRDDLFVCRGGCNGTAGEKAESSAEVKQLKTALEESQQQKGQLQGDVTRLEKSLNEAESGLADARKIKDELQTQIQDLTVSRSRAWRPKVGDLEGKVGQLTTSRTELQQKLDQLTTSRDQLQQRVDELVKSRDDLQAMVTNLVDTRGTLEKQVAALTKSRNAAMEDAKSAQSKVDLLSDRLKTQTQQMIELQDQMKSVRAVLAAASAEARVDPGGRRGFENRTAGRGGVCGERPVMARTHLRWRAGSARPADTRVCSMLR